MLDPREHRNREGPARDANGGRAAPRTPTSRCTPRRAAANGAMRSTSRGCTRASAALRARGRARAGGCPRRDRRPLQPIVLLESGRTIGSRRWRAGPPGPRPRPARGLRAARRGDRPDLADRPEVLREACRQTRRVADGAARPRGDVRRRSTSRERDPDPAARARCWRRRHGQGFSRAPDPGDHRARRDARPRRDGVRAPDLRTSACGLRSTTSGRGYSSLSHLRDFPIDILKIAKPFVDGLHDETFDPILAHAIVGLRFLAAPRVRRRGDRGRQAGLEAREARLRDGAGASLRPPARGGDDRPLPAQPRGETPLDLQALGAAG